jgi:hypothetical protein
VRLENALPDHNVEHRIRKQGNGDGYRRFLHANLVRSKQSRLASRKGRGDKNKNPLW